MAKTKGSLKAAKARVKALQSRLEARAADLETLYAQQDREVQQIIALMEEALSCPTPAAMLRKNQEVTTALSRGLKTLKYLGTEEDALTLALPNRRARR